jgi:two-component system LytT family sensor kinase
VSPAALSAAAPPRREAGLPPDPPRSAPPGPETRIPAPEVSGVRALLDDPLALRAFVAAVVVYAVMLAWVRSGAPGKFSRPEHIALRLAGDVGMLLAMGWGAFALAARFPLESLRGRRAAALAAALLALWWAFACVRWLLLCVVYSRRCSRGWLQMALDQGGLLDFAVAFLAIAYGLQYARRHRAHEIAAARLSARLADARLAALKAQLHPHFLFNTFHSVAALMQHQPAAAQAMLRRLSALLEVTLERAGAHEVTLDEELALVEMYAGIEKVRFSDRLSVDVRADEGVRGALVPHLLLQPLVENAVKHGISARPGPGRIAVSAREEGGRLVVRVSDDGPGVSVRPAPDGNGIGVANTRARLEALYGAAHHFRMAPNERGGVTVTVALPLRRPGGGGGA